MNGATSPVFADVPLPGPESLEALLSDERFLDLGESVFYLLSSWAEWVERRVEFVDLVSLNTVTRRVSVDFTVPILPAPIGVRRGQPVRILPLALQRKRRLVAFDLRDEAGRSLSLIPHRQNAPLSAAVLVAAAQSWVGGEISDAEALPPKPILDDLWAIATRRSHSALRIWGSLGRPVTDAEAETQWRHQLALSPEFMSLAYDLAHSFIMLALVEAGSGDRRVLKFSYQEPTDVADPSAVRPLQVRLESQQAGAPPSPDETPVGDARGSASQEGLGRIRITADIARSEDGGDPPGDARGACAGIAYAIIRGDARYAATTDRDGTAVAQVPIGNYKVVEESLPSRLVPITPVATVTVAAGAEATASFRYAPVAPGVRNTQALPRLRRVARFRRLLGIDPKPVVLFAPAIGQAHAYHLEFEAPDGLQVTCAELSEAGWEPDTGASAKTVDATSVTSQRVHVRVRGLEQDRAGAGRFLLRPRDTTILRPALLTGVFSLAVLLCLLAISTFSLWQPRTGVLSAAPLATLLLVVPGGLSAYVSRGPEHAFTSRFLFGLRMLALSNGFWCFAAAAVLVLGDLMHPAGMAGALEPLEEGFIALAAICVGQALSTLMLWTSLRKAFRPPESLLPSERD